MNNGGNGYLAKLRALRAMKRPVSAHEIARYLDAAYETARSAMRRMEKSGHVVGVRSDARWRGEVLFSLTALGEKALDAGVEFSVGRGVAHKPGPRVRTGGPVAAVYEWRDLHAALDMGVPIVGKLAHRVDMGMDREPVRG